MYYGAIYKITNTVNGKVYIGQSTQPSVRLRTHFSPKAILDVKSPLHRAVMKYGKESFVTSIIAVALDQASLDEQEKALISAYDSTSKEFGYNICLGGRGVPTQVHWTKTDPEKWKAVKKKLQGIPRPKGSLSPNSKPVVLESGVFGCVEDVCESLGITKAIYYARKRDGDLSERSLVKRLPNAKRVRFNGVVYPSLRDVSNSEGIPYSTLRGRAKQGKVDYVDEASREPAKKTDPRSRHAKHFEFNGLCFYSIKDASEFYGVTRQTMKNRLRKAGILEEGASTKPKSVLLDGVVYPSIKEAARSLQRSESYIRTMAEAA